MRSARSEARKATRSPTGSGQPNLPRGRLREMKSATTSGGLSFWKRSHEPSGWEMEPGAMLLTRTPSVTRLMAACLVALMRADFAAM